jgi:ASC-1-like (ASCH) protein
MITRWESGRESGLLDHIISGRKTIEGRLNRSKFAQYKVADTISLRRDVRDAAGILHDGEPGSVTVKIVAVRKYSTFLDLVTNEGYNQVIPDAEDAQSAADMYNQYYSAADQARYGVLAIEIIIVEL